VDISCKHRSSQVPHRAVLAVADFGQVHPGDDAEPSRQPLQQQPDDGGGQQHPEELTRGEQSGTICPLAVYMSSNKGQYEFLSIKYVIHTFMMKMISIDLIHGRHSDLSCR